MNWLMMSSGGKVQSDTVNWLQEGTGGGWRRGEEGTTEIRRRRIAAKERETLVMTEAQRRGFWRRGGAVGFLIMQTCWEWDDIQAWVFCDL